MSEREVGIHLGAVEDGLCEKLGFSLFSILIDFGASSLGALKEFSDRITDINQHASDSVRDIFLTL